MSSNHRKPEERPVIEAMGEKKSLLEWSLDSRCVVSYDTLRQRLVRGWRMSRAMTTSSREPKPEVIEDATPSRTYGNYAMPPGSYIPPTWPGPSNVNRRV